MEDALLEVLHDESDTSDELMQHWTAVDVLRGCTQDLVRFREVGYLAENVWKLLESSQNVRYAFILHRFYCLVRLVHVSVALTELIENFLNRGPSVAILLFTLFWFVVCLWWPKCKVSRCIDTDSRRQLCWFHSSFTKARSTCIDHLCLWFSVARSRLVSSRSCPSPSKEVLILGGATSLALTCGAGRLIKIGATDASCTWGTVLILKGLGWYASSSHLSFPFIFTEIRIDVDSVLFAMICASNELVALLRFLAKINYQKFGPGWLVYPDRLIYYFYSS